MAIAERTAQTTWQGTLASGSGTIRPASGALGDLPVTWASRTTEPGGKTSPEELAAAAHSSCFAMALALRLGEHDATAERLTVTATVTLDEVDGIPTVLTACLVAVTAAGVVQARRMTRIRQAALRQPGNAKLAASVRRGAVSAAALRAAIAAFSLALIALGVLLAP
jgi:lipoyl-dependent peroxiredoxin